MIPDAPLAVNWASWFGNLHEFVPYPWALFLLVAISVVCGAMIGKERRARRKPIGVRTVTLICMGSTIFAIVSILMARSTGADPARIAAQVVTGIGFLGAGTILHNRGQVRGLTTAATIWVVAAMGLLIGAGYALPAVILSAVVVALLRLHSHSLKRARERQASRGESGRQDDGPR